MTRPIDAALQGQVDGQLMEQGAFTPLELLIDSGRLLYSDYERWRRREIDTLDEVLMGNRERIQAQLQQAVGYAVAIGLGQESQDFYPWADNAAGDMQKPLKISVDRNFAQLVSGRYTPRSDAPQLDMFFDNPVVALTNSLTVALASRNLTEVQRQLNQLYQRAPNHADLTAYDQLLLALQHLGQPIPSPQDELAFLTRITPLAKRLLSSQSRDLLAPLWRQLAAAIEGKRFSIDNPALHASFLLGQAQDWVGVSAAIRAEPQWWQFESLCQRLAEADFYWQNRNGALSAWFQWCWLNPVAAALKLEQRQHPDRGLDSLWQGFLDWEDGLNLAESLSAELFPAWVLLFEPGLIRQLPKDLPSTEGPGQSAYRLVFELIEVHKGQGLQASVEARRFLQQQFALLFEYAKQRLRF